MRMKTPFGKWWPLYSGLSVLIHCPSDKMGDISEIGVKWFIIVPVHQLIWPDDMCCDALKEVTIRYNIVLSLAIVRNEQEVLTDNNQYIPIKCRNSTKKHLEITTRAPLLYPLRTITVQAAVAGRVRCSWSQARIVGICFPALNNKCIVERIVSWTM